MKRQNTLRIKRLTEAIPQYKTLADAGRAAGYSPKARNIYRKNTREHIKELITIDDKEVMRRFNEVYDMSREAKDRTNMARTTEALARILGLNLDRAEIKQNIDNTQAIIHKHLTINRIG